MRYRFYEASFGWFKRFTVTGPKTLCDPIPQWWLVMVFVGTCPANKLPFVWKLNDRCRAYNTARDIFVLRKCRHHWKTTYLWVYFSASGKEYKRSMDKRKIQKKNVKYITTRYLCMYKLKYGTKKKLLNQLPFNFICTRYVTIINTIPKRTKRLWKVFIRQLIALIAPFARMDVSTTLRSRAPPLSDVIILNILSRHPCHGYDRLNEAAGGWSRRWFLELILATERSKPFPRLAVRGGNKWSCRRRSLSANSRGYIYMNLESW